MSVACPNCGTHIEDPNTEVCPACRHRLGSGPTMDVEEDVRWCESCGSPIPAGNKACPECGMPVEGAFDEEQRERFSVRPVYDAKKESRQEPELNSAIPPAPETGDKKVSAEERRRRNRLMLVSALAAILLVGGVSLYITRPWDPDAYKTHAMKDADTSMEGFPGEKTHLSSQDLKEEEERKALVSEMESAMNEIYARLETIANEAKESRDLLVSTGSTGSKQYLYDDAAGEQVAQMQRKLDDAKSQLEGLSLDSAQKERKEKILVLVGYLRGAVDVLANAWSAASQDAGSPDQMVRANAILRGSAGSRGFDEWYELFQNAYAS